ncbi:NAD(P)-dependent malic enzyme [Microbacterium sp. ASV49]|uniref:NADP-dependent malic enzyme n=1 Tax=Microbacterium candidum TaxID=3041922 RepID=A0ABT7MYG2_9MICO|nr:NADP-dependent malic enzyme [Microbacterium sp. ASV49]MDL9979493.1 NADP-dependent malic enzyme [Microbacterium sp. ASV49]
MANPSPGYSIQLRAQAPVRGTATKEIVTAITEAGALVHGLDVDDSGHETLVIDLNVYTSGTGHADEVAAAIAAIPGVTVIESVDRTFALHEGGKLTVDPTAPLLDRDDLSRAYTPGVARVCLDIAANPENVNRYTVKGNTVAVVTDGSAVLGLGNIGAAASLPVMEGKAVLFKQFAGVDAWPVALDTQDTEEIISIVKAIAPVYGGINLEDIAAPRCFEIERRLREELDIPVFHDDQHGTAIVTLAALVNALKLVEKKIEDVNIVISGVGAAGNAIIQLLQAQGAQHIVAAGRAGIIHIDDEYTDPHRLWIAQNTNQGGRTGSLADALVGADVFIGVSAPNLFGEEELKTMAPGAIVFAMANPDPEVDPKVAAKYATIVATGRSDFPNQINNVLAFPGLFRGLLDARASDITTDMLVAAAQAIASCVTADELHAQYIIPSAFDQSVAPAVAEAVRRTASASIPSATAA